MELKILFKLLLFFLTQTLSLLTTLQHYVHRVRLTFHSWLLIFLFGSAEAAIAHYGRTYLKNNKTIKHASVVLTANPQRINNRDSSRRARKLVQLLQWLQALKLPCVSLYSAHNELIKFPIENSLKMKVRELEPSDEIFHVIKKEKKELKTKRSHEEVREFINENELLGAERVLPSPQIILVFDQEPGDLNLRGYPSLMREQAEIYAMGHRLEQVNCAGLIEKLGVFGRTEIRLGK